MASKKAIIFILVLTVIILITFIFTHNRSNQSNDKLLNNLTIENENILKSGSEITIEAEVQNNNHSTVTVKSIEVVLTDENGEKIKNLTIQINKRIKPNKKTTFSEKIKIATDQRTFTKYNIKI